MGLAQGEQTVYKHPEHPLLLTDTRALNTCTRCGSGAKEGIGAARRFIKN